MDLGFDRYHIDSSHNDGGTDMKDRETVIVAVVLMIIIIVGNLGGLWWASNW